MEPVLVYPIIYVLECENSKYYVGITTNFNYRWAQHLAGSGAKWTRLHKPIRVIEIITDNVSLKLETETAEKYIRQYGRLNVAGGGYT
jgi:predicted GIY-YIG superfamily endonuclease